MPTELNATELKATLKYIFSLYSAANAELTPFTGEIPDSVKEPFVAKQKELMGQLKLYINHYETLLSK